MPFKMMLAKGNLLFMDEPTNHLDLESITALNNAMSEYRGTLLFTSHDQQLVNTVANRIIEITPKGTITKMMSYNDYLKDDKIIALRNNVCLMPKTKFKLSAPTSSAIFTC